MQKSNADLRQAAKQGGIPLWRIADCLGVSEVTLVRKLRYELPDGEKVKLLEIIDQLVKERESVR